MQWNLALSASGRMMGWLIATYIFFSAVVAYTTGVLSTALYAIGTSIVSIIAGGGLKYSFSGDTTQKLVCPIIAALLMVLAQWLSHGFSVQLIGYHFTGAEWGWAGFLVSFLFAAVCEIKAPPNSADISWRELDTLGGGACVPIIFGTLYGVYKFITKGLGNDFFLCTYTAFFGGILASGCFFVWVWLSAAPRKSSLLLAIALETSEYVIDTYSLYVVGFLGVYSIYDAVAGTSSTWSIVFGLFCIAIGYRGLTQFYLFRAIALQRFLSGVPRT